jgi:hypothetical protein
MQTRALVDFGELSLNRAMRIYGPVGDLSVFEGRYYPSKAPLMSFAAVPVYAVLRSFAGGSPGSVPEIPLVFFSRLFLTILPTLLSLMLLERLLATYVERSVAVGLTWAYALGTLAFSYSLLFMSHQTTATLLLAGFYVCWRVIRGEGPIAWLVLSGALLGLAVVAEYTSALPAIAVAAYAVFAMSGPTQDRARAAAFVMLGALPTAVVLGWYHLACFGGVLETGYRHLADVAYQPWHEGGFLGIKTPTWTAFVGSFFSPLRGLFALSPVLILGFAGLPAVWRRRRDSTQEFARIVMFTVILCMGYVYFTSSFSYESWGWTTGPRHLTGLVPFLLLPVGVVFNETKSTWLRGVWTGLALSSIVVTSALTFVNYIPDDVSNGVFGLSVPLTATGFTVPTLLSFFGVTSPWAGGFVICLVAALAVLVTILLTRASIKGAAVALLVLLTLIGANRLSYRDDDHDRAARALLERVWLVPPGSSASFWTTSGRAPR